MSLDLLVASALNDAKDLGQMEQATVVTQVVIKELEDTPIRAEIYEKIQYETEVNIADIHQIMDALVCILRGE